MTVTGLLNGALAAIGFLAGHLWAVEAWAARSEGLRAELLAAAILPGVCLSAAYGFGLVVTLGPFLATHPRGGIRSAVAPISFSVSLLAAAAATRAILTVLEG